MWRRSRRCAAYLLYLELGSHQWQARMPPQLCGPDAMRLNASFPRCPVPGHGLRLAGSIACGPDGEEALPVLSAFDGLHLVVYPEEHGALAAWVTIGGWTLPVCVRDVTWDPPLPQDTEAMLAH